MRKAIATLLLLLGLALIVAVFSAAAYPRWLTLPGGILALIVAAFLGIADLGGKIKDWRDLLFGEKKSEPPAPAPSISASGTGATAAQNVLIGTQINNPVTLVPPPPAPTPGGFIPAQAAEIYIERGDIETQVRERLRRRGVAAIVGVHAPGGVGKTELAKRAAHDLGAEFEKTLWLDVGVKTREQVIGDLAVQCQLEFKPDWDYGQRVVALKQFLQGRNVLIIFDDVRPNNAPSLTDFLPPSPPCAALITSRVSQLSAAIPATFKLDAMTAAQARRLLETALTPARVQAEAPAAQALAERCKFNPLALTIAARRIGLLGDMARPIAFVAEKVRKRLAELKVGDDPRNDLFAVFDESYEALSADDARRFRALSVFAPTGFSPAAVARVWNEAQLDAEQALSRLLNLSLLKVASGGTERYRLHDLLDEYAASKLPAAEADSANRAHAEFLIALFRKHSTIDPSTAPEVAPELDNLRAAANWTMEKREGNLLASLAYYPRNWLYNVFRINEEWLSWLTASLRFGIEERGLQANVLQAIGDVQSFRDERDAALESYRQALELFRAVGARLGEASVLQAIGDVQSFRKDNDAALKSYEAALELFRAVGARLGEANVLASQGKLLVVSGKAEEGLKLLQGAATIYEGLEA